MGRGGGGKGYVGPPSKNTWGGGWPPAPSPTPTPFYAYEDLDTAIINCFSNLKTFSAVADHKTALKTWAETKLKKTSISKVSKIKWPRFTCI